MWYQKWILWLIFISKMYTFKIIHHSYSSKSYDAPYFWQFLSGLTSALKYFQVFEKKTKEKTTKTGQWISRSQSIWMTNFAMYIYGDTILSWRAPVPLKAYSPKLKKLETANWSSLFLIGETETSVILVHSWWHCYIILLVSTKCWNLHKKHVYEFRMFWNILPLNLLIFFRKKIPSFASRWLFAKQKPLCLSMIIVDGSTSTYLNIEYLKKTKTKTEALIMIIMMI